MNVQASNEDAMLHMRYATEYSDEAKNRTARQYGGAAAGGFRPQIQSFVAAVTGIPLQQECPG